MKKTFATLMICTAFLASAALAGDFDFDLESNDWWQKEGFFNIEGYYTQLQLKDYGETMPGGGGAIGAEYVNKDSHFGIGGRASLAWVMKGSIYDQTFSYLDVDDRLLGLDLYIPVRLADFLTVYGGGGGTLHGMTLTADNGGEMNSHGDGAITSSLFAGVRLRYGHVYFFGEYRSEFGDVKVTYQTYAFDGIHKRDVDVSCSTFRVGAGVVF